MNVVRMKLQIMSLLVLSGYLMIQKVEAQADISLATHWYNRANYNPASIAKTNYLYLFSNVRQQWLGIEGSPGTFNVQASEYFHDIHSAFGVSFVGEKIGATQAYNPMITYAYRVSNNQDWWYSLGISAGVFSRLINGSLYEAETAVDPSISYAKETTTSPDANVGFEYQSTNFIFSLSTTHILSIKKPDNLYLNANHRYGSVIYKNSNPELFNYHVGIQVINRSNLTVFEGNASIRFKRPTLLQSGPSEIFDLGITYRSSSQLTLLFGINISSNLKVGYAYDQSFIKGTYHNGSHELMLEYRIPFKVAFARFQGEEPDNWYH
jgi:type IX secretion system PorP/SprF family membrane protein